MMNKLQATDLYSLEEYARRRDEFRASAVTHKRLRELPLGDNLTLYFEDRLTMQYQVQEMLRSERIFEPEGIAEELDAYNPLIPDGSNWKATLMIQFADVNERRVALAELVGVEDRIWVRVDGHDAVWAIADEDLERSTEEKTSSVHFLRFELTAGMIAALRAGAALSAGVDHDRLRVSVENIGAPLRDSLLSDLD